MRTRRSMITVVGMVLCAALASTSASAVANSSRQVESSKGHDRFDQECLPGIEIAVRRNRVYRELYGVLASHRADLKALLGAVVDQTSYEALLTEAESIASMVDGGRVVLTLPDGTVVVDTASENNSYEGFTSKTVNENHNSRVAIFAAQLYPCGIGLERKLSTSTGETESYLALRLGSHLDSVGTARLSATQTD